jgi:DNA-binding Xre family transcriptional regulator
MSREKIESVLTYIQTNLKDRDVMELSKKMNISRPTIIKLKNGNCPNVTIKTLLVLCDYIKENYEK